MTHSTRAAAGIAALVVLAGLAWWLVERKWPSVHGTSAALLVESQAAPAPSEFQPFDVVDAPILEATEDAETRSAVAVEPAPRTEQAKAPAARRPDEMSVRVVDASGRALAGIDLVVDYDQGHARLHGTTSPQNGGPPHARFEHDDVMRAGGSATRAFVRAHLPILPQVEAAFSAFDPPHEPITLTLPETGTVEVLIEDVDGEPYQDPAWIALDLEPRGERRVSDPRREHLGWVSSPSKDGRVRFEHVSPGLDVELTVRFVLGTDSLRVVAPGPAVPGATAIVRVPVGRDHPILSLRVLDVHGEPVRKRMLAASVSEIVQGATHSQSEMKFETDEDGHVRVLSSQELTKAESAVVFRLYHEEPSLGATGHVVEQSASLTVSGPFVPGIRDCGDVALRPFAELAAGRVIDAQGDPVEGAEVRFVYVEPSEPRWGPVQQRPWGVTKSGVDGAFHISGPHDVVWLQAWASKGTRESAPRAVQAGTMELVLRFLGESGLAGWLRVEGYVPEGGYAVAARSEGGHAIWVSRPRPIEPDGSFQHLGIRAGSYRVTLYDTSRVEPLLEIRDVVVRQGEITRDPRLAGIELPGLAAAFILELDKADPGTLGAGVVRVRPAGDARVEWTNARFQAQERRLAFLVPAGDVDLEVVFPRYRTVRLFGVRESAAAELVPGIQVRLRFCGPAALPEAPFALRAMLAPVERPQDFNWGADPFDDSRETMVSAADVGAMQVVWILERSEGGGSTGTRVSVASPEIFDVRDVECQVFDVHVSQAELDAAIAWLDE
jgi:hypothetical protein